MLGLIQASSLQADKTNTIPLVKVFNRRVKVPLPIPEIKEVVQQRKFTITAYDLSFQSTQKSRGSKDYGITSSGYSLKGHTLTSARVIATDPKIIPTGSKVRLTFLDAKYLKYNGIYISRDQGEGIKNYHVDLFIGDYVGSNKNARDFGVTQCELEIIKES